MSKLKSEDPGLTSGYTLLMLKAEEGNVNEVHRMITELKNADINASNKRGYTSLAIAVKAGHFDVVKLLLLSGSNPNAKNNSGQSPLFLACWNNHEQIVRLLLDSGAEINAVDHRGWTPLMISAYHGHKQILRELLARDADTSIQDLFGKKAIDRAKDAEVVKILQDSEHIDDNNTKNRPYNIITNPVIHNPKENLSLQYSPIPYTTVLVEKKVDKNYQPPSILKKSNSKTSVGIGRTTMDRNQSFVSPQTPQGGSLSAQKSHSVSSTHRKTVGNLQRPSTQAKALNNSRKEPQSAGKNTPMLRSFLQDTTSPKSTISTKRVPGSPTGGDLQRQAFKEDMERLLQDQMGFMCERVQQVVENKIALEVPMQMQDYENQFKEQVESILRFKAADIFRNLQNIFGLKLKFCLSRLGYDTRYLEQATSLESETSFNPETIRFIQEPPKRYNEKEFKGIENEINKVEKTILSHKVPQPSSTLRKSQPESPRYGEHQCDHTSQLHRSEIRNDLLDQMGHEMRATTEYLLDFSKSKVGELTREESGILYKKIVAEVTDNMEALETELKTKFEEVIAEKLNRVVDYLGRASQNGNSIDFKTLEKTDQSTHKIIRSSFYNTSEQDYQTSDAREERLEGNPTQEESRKGSQYSEMQKANENALRAQQEASQAKEKIQRIKNSLNFMDDEEGEPKSERFRHSRSNFKGDIRNERTSKVEVPVEEESANFSVPVKTEEGSYEEPERIYNPTYRSTLKTETTQQLSNREYWSQPESRGTNVPAKGVAKSGRSTQSRGTTDSKSGAKQVIPGHRFAFNDSKEQELIKCYDFSHE